MARTVFPPSGNLTYRPLFNLRIRPEGDYFGAEILGDGVYREFNIRMKLKDVTGLCGNLRGAMQDVAAACEDLRLTSAGLKEKLQPLADVGYLAFTRIFQDSRDQEMMRNLTKTRGENATPTIQVTSESFFFPWELVYPWGTSESLSWIRFWGFSQIISRVIAVKDKREPIPPTQIEYSTKPRVGLLTDLSVENVREREVPYFRELAKNGKINLEQLRPLKPDLKRAELTQLKDFLDKPLHVAHFACHGSVKDVTCIVLSDEFAISLEDLEIADVTVPSSPLVVMNACETGCIDPEYTFNFVNHFYRQARGVVATECEVPDEFAAAFSRELYARLLKENPLGDAVLAVRKHFLNEFNNPLGLLYCMYAPPTLQLAPRKDQL